jgi:hypothetical protein
MTEMDASFQELAHAVLGQRHWDFSGFSSADM